MLHPAYQDCEPLLQGMTTPPRRLDPVTFDFGGVHFRVYGILHGVTGGHNREYVRFVRESIREAEGLVLAEKGMKAIYGGCGIADELDDWLVLRVSDSLLLGFTLIADPRCLRLLLWDSLRELLTRRDPFRISARRTVADLNGSPCFHLLEPVSRRQVHGHPDSETALRQDLHSLSHWAGSILPEGEPRNYPHPIYRRMMLLRRFMHIPARSIHMLFFCLGLAEREKAGLVSVFVGETHNSDMLFLAGGLEAFRDSLPQRQREVFDRLRQRALRFSAAGDRRNRLHLLLLQGRYLAALTIGGSIALAGWAGAVMIAYAALEGLSLL